jgi:hypothetical protein
MAANRSKTNLDAICPITAHIRCTAPRSTDVAGPAGCVQVSWGIDLATEHERYLTEAVYKQPVIVYNYPKDIKAFYMKANADGKTVAAMDVLVPKVCAGGGAGGAQLPGHSLTLSSVLGHACAGAAVRCDGPYVALQPAVASA